MFRFVRQFSSKWRANRWHPTKITKQHRRQSLIMYFENNANQSALFRFQILNRESKLTASFLKYEVMNGSCSINFCWISTIWFSCESLKCTLLPFQWEGGRCYYNGPQLAALGLIGPSWCHQNRLWSANLLHYARSNRTEGRWRRGARGGRNDFDAGNITRATGRDGLWKLRLFGPWNGNQQSWASLLQKVTVTLYCYRDIKFF